MRIACGVCYFGVAVFWYWFWELGFSFLVALFRGGLHLSSLVLIFVDLLLLVEFGVGLCLWCLLGFDCKFAFDLWVGCIWLIRVLWVDCWGCFWVCLWVCGIVCCLV